MSSHNHYEQLPARGSQLATAVLSKDRRVNPNNKPHVDLDANYTNIERLKEIDSQGGIAEFARKNDMLIRNGLRIANADTASCSDGRIIGIARRTPGTALGSIHLLGEPEDKVKKTYNRLGIKRVTTHPGCGAAKAAYLAKYPRDINARDLDERVMRWQQEESEDIATRMGVIHIPLGEQNMTRKKGHSAPLIIVNGTGKNVDPARAGLPNSFVVDRVVTPKYAQAVALLRGVAEQPGNTGAQLKERGDTMRVITIARTDEDAARMQKNIRAASPDLKQESIILKRR